MKKILLILIALLSTSSFVAPAYAEETDPFYELLSQKIEPSSEPLQGQFMRIYEKVHGFIPTQTQLDMERLITLQTKQRGDIIESQTLFQLAGEGCYDASHVQKNAQKATKDEPKNTLASQTYTFQYYLGLCKKNRMLNTRFAKTLSSLSYKSMFMDGDEKNSSYDLLSDVNALKLLVDGKLPPIKASWNADISDDAKYFLGFAYKPEYTALDTKKIEDMQKLYTFDTTPQTLGMCTLQTPPPIAENFSSREKESITKSFARFERDKLTPDPSFDNEAILQKDTTKDPTRKITDALSGVQKVIENAGNNLGKDMCATGSAYNKDGTGGMAGACIKLEIKAGIGEETPPVFTSDRLPSLMDSLKKMRASTGELAAQDLQLKNEPRSIFSLAWEDFHFKFSENPLVVTYVPIVPVIGKNQYATKETVRSWSQLWNVLTTNTASVAPGTVKSNNTLNSGARTEQQDVTAQQEIKDLSTALVVPRMNQASLSDMEVTVGAQFDHVIAELELFEKQLGRLKAQSKQFSSTPTQ